MASVQRHSTDQTPRLFHQEWAGGTFYEHDIVRDGAWLMAANKLTTDRPAPQPLDSPTYLLPDAPSWTSGSLTGVVNTGLEITNIADKAFLVSNMRVWLPSVSNSTAYRVLAANLITSEVGVVASFRGDVLLAPGWYTLPNITPVFLFGGDEVAFELEAWDTSSTTQFSGDWAYSSANNDQIPLSGEAYERANRSWVRFHYNDDAATDRSAELLSVVPGSTISFAAQVFEVVQVTDAPGSSYVEYEIIRQAVSPPASTYTFSFDVPVPASTSYVWLPGHWTSNPLTNAQARGFEYLDNNSPTYNDNAYGIDLEVTEYSASDDWELLALSADVGGGGSAAPSDLSIGDPITGGTANRVLYEDVNNQLAEDPNLTWDGTTLTVSPNLDVASVAYLAGNTYVANEFRHNVNSDFFFSAGAVGSNGRLVFRMTGNLSQRAVLTNQGVWCLGQLADLPSTADWYTLVQAPSAGAPTLAVGRNTTALYNKSGELWCMDSGGVETQLSSHDEVGHWVHNSRNTRTGKSLKIDLERFFKEKFPEYVTEEDDADSSTL